MPFQNPENIQAAHAELQEILTQVGDAIIGCDFEETLTYFNKAAEKRYGVSSADAVGKKLWEVFKYEWVRPEDEAAAHRALQEQGEWHGQNIHFTRDGRKLYVDSWVRILRDPQGHPKGLLAVIRDMTVVKKHEAELRERDQLLRLHIENSPMAVVEWDKDLRVIRWEGQAESMFGWSSQELLGRRFSELDLVYAEDIPIVEKVSTALVSGKTRYLTAVNRNNTKDGRVISCIWHNSVVVDSEGQMRSILSLVQDVTAQANAGRALKASEEIHRLVTESSQTGFWEWDLGTNEVHYSSIYKKQLGYSDDEIGSGIEVFRKLCHPEDFDAVIAQLLATQADPTVPFNREVRMLHKDGSWRWIWCQAIVLHDSAGKAVRMLGTHIDLTEQKKNVEQIRQLNTELEDRVLQRTKELKKAVRILETEIAARRRLEQEVLETSEREQSRLGQDLHDDLGQQLASIGMLVQLLGAQLQAQLHPKAADAAELSFLCRNALETTRNLARSFYPVELEQLGLQIAIESLAHRTEAVTETVCRTKFSNRFRARKEAAIHLYRIVQESISNAIKHGRARNILIEGSQRPGWLTLTITDDGIGFEQNTFSNGLGLHIFQYRARLIGAQVSVERACREGGCRVTCLLPASKGPAKAGKQPGRRNP